MTKQQTMPLVFMCSCTVLNAFNYSHSNRQIFIISVLNFFIFFLYLFLYASAVLSACLIKILKIMPEIYVNSLELRFSILIIHFIQDYIQECSVLHKIDQLVFQLKQWSVLCLIKQKYLKHMQVSLHLTVAQKIKLTCWRHHYIEDNCYYQVFHPAWETQPKHI